MARKGKQRPHQIFVYGSNLHVGQMFKRCPDAQLVGPAGLPGGRLVFAGYSETWQGGVATIAGDRKCVVYGAVYALTDADLERLDACEGARMPGAGWRAWIPAYERRTVRVKVARHRGAPRLLKVQTYIKPEVRFSLPSEAYINRIREGYEDLGLPVNELEDAVIDFFAMDGALSLTALGD